MDLEGAMIAATYVCHSGQSRKHEERYIATPRERLDFIIPLLLDIV